MDYGYVLWISMDFYGFLWIIDAYHGGWGSSRPYFSMDFPGTKTIQRFWGSNIDGKPHMLERSLQQKGSADRFLNGMKIIADIIEDCLHGFLSDYQAIPGKPGSKTAPKKIYQSDFRL